MEMNNNSNMLNFTVGPVQTNEMVRKIGSEQIPYFRTEEFSKLMLENEELIKEFVYAPKGSRSAFITGSGTAAMEATIINTLNTKDRALIINGGSFGQRFVDICKIYEIPYDEIKLEIGSPITNEILSQYDGNRYTCFLVNICETSTGVHYDMNLIGDYCRKYNLFLIADDISSFLADPFNMAETNVDVFMTGSQKALACPPGISIVVLSPKAIKKVYMNNPKTLYLDLKLALNNGERGQTPFTPAVGILRQINARLNEIKNNGGVEFEITKTKKIAEDFRSKIKELPLEIITESLSNAVTPLRPKNKSAYDIFLTLKDNYNIWICPNGGNLKDTVFRVGHIGYITVDDNKQLIDALDEVLK